jgi:hypothetical protein
MDEFTMTVVVQIDLSCALTALSLAHVTSLTEILLAHIVTNIAFALPVYTHMPKETECFGHLTLRFQC